MIIYRNLKMEFFDFCALVSSPSRLATFFLEKGVLCAACDCGKCSVRMTLQTSSRMADGVCYRCPKCKATVSIRKDSFLKNSKLPLRVFAAILFFHHTEILRKHVVELLSSHIDEFLWIERYGRTLIERWNNWFLSFSSNS